MLRRLAYIQTPPPPPGWPCGANMGVFNEHSQVGDGRGRGGSNGYEKEAIYEVNEDEDETLDDEVNEDEDETLDEEVNADENERENDELFHEINPRPQFKAGKSLLLRADNGSIARQKSVVCAVFSYCKCTGVLYCVCMYCIVYRCTIMCTGVLLCVQLYSTVYILTVSCTVIL